MSLVAEGVSVRFGGLAAIEDVSFTLEPGEIVGLIGPNGAGKTTLVNVLSGFQKPSAGEVRLEGRRFVGATPDAFARAGIARTFQAVRLFKGLSVSENLEVSLVANGLSRRRARERAKALLAEFLPGDRGRMPAAALTYGEERKVGIARALALEPRYLLLDEPAAGMAAAEVEDLRSAIVRVRAAYGCGILVVEHNMALIFALCDRIHVLGSGRTIASRLAGRNQRQCESARGLSRRVGERIRMSSSSEAVLRVEDLTIRYDVRDRRQRRRRSKSARVRSSRSSARTAPAKARSCRRSPQSRPEREAASKSAGARPMASLAAKS